MCKCSPTVPLHTQLAPHIPHSQWTPHTASRQELATRRPGHHVDRLQGKHGGNISTEATITLRFTRENANMVHLFTAAVGTGAAGYCSARNVSQFLTSTTDILKMRVALGSLGPHLCYQIVWQGADVFPGPSFIQVYLRLHGNRQKLQAAILVSHALLFNCRCCWWSSPSPPRAARPDGTKTLRYWRRCSSASEASSSPGSARRAREFRTSQTHRTGKNRCFRLPYLLLNVPHHHRTITAGRGLCRNSCYVCFVATWISILRLCVLFYAIFKLRSKTWRPHLPLWAGEPACCSAYDGFVRVAKVFLNHLWRKKDSDLPGWRITHQVVIFGIKGDAEDGRFVASERLLLAAVRHLHHLHHEVAGESRGTNWPVSDKRAHQMRTSRTANCPIDEKKKRK